MFDNNLKNILCVGYGKFGKLYTEVFLKSGDRVCGVVSSSQKENILKINESCVPIYKTIAEAFELNKIDYVAFFVPAKYIKDMIVETIDKSPKAIIVFTEHIPLHDEVFFNNYAKLKNVNIVGPNTFGFFIPEVINLSFTEDDTFCSLSKGHVAIITKSGTLLALMTSIFQKNGISIAIDVGGDRTCGVSILDVLKYLKDDMDTEEIFIHTESNFSEENEILKYLNSIEFGKKIHILICGIAAPENVTLGHAGAIIKNAKQNISYIKNEFAKIKNVFVYDTIFEMCIKNKLK
jgi:succinyl-CoA synthetase alpha subunit